MRFFDIVWCFWQLFFLIFRSAAINGPEMVLAERVPDMEEYLPVIVFRQISPEMKKETIKAQTVIARSNIQRWLGEGKKYSQRS